MVSEKKEKEVKEIKELIEKYPVIGVLDLFKMPSRQLQSIKKELRGKVKIRMYKKRLVKLALERVKNKKNIKKLNELEPKEPALIFTEMNPLKLYRVLDKNKSPTYARANDVAQKDIVIPSGPTNLPAGPAIGELQRVKIPALVKEGKIHVRKDTTVVKEGETITKQVANLLKKLKIQPAEIGISILGAWEDGEIFKVDILAVSEEEYIDKIKSAFINSLNLCVNVCYPNKESIKVLLKKAYQNARSVGINAGVLEKDILKDLIVKANVQAQSLKTNIEK